MNDIKELPVVGYNAKAGNLVTVIDDDDLDIVVQVAMPDECIIIGHRVAKFVQTPNGKVQYHIDTPQSEMVDGRMTITSQAVLLMDGVVCLFGTSSFTGNVMFSNTEDDRFAQGILDRLNALGVVHPRYATVQLRASSRRIDVGMPKREVTVYPLEVGETIHVSKASEVDAIYKQYNVEDWGNEWNVPSLIISGGD